MLVRAVKVTLDMALRPHSSSRKTSITTPDHQTETVSSDHLASKSPELWESQVQVDPT